MTSQEKVEMRSIIDNHWRCFICKSERNLELHHCISAADRIKADQDGLFLALCMNCHTALHDKGIHKKDLQRIAQEAYIRRKEGEGYSEGQARGIWFNRYARYYD